MKRVVVSSAGPDVAELLRLAREENVILCTESGEEFILAELDDFDRELALVRQQPELMALLRARAQEPPAAGLRAVRGRLGLPE